MLPGPKLTKWRLRSWCAAASLLLSAAWRAGPRLQCHTAILHALQEAIFRQPHDAEHPKEGAAPPQAAAAPPEGGARLQLPPVTPPLPAAANNLSIDHLLMLANLTSGGGMEWPSAGPLPQGAASGPSQSPSHLGALQV